MNINTLTQRDQELLLRFTKAVVEASAAKNAPAVFSLDMDDETSLREASERSQELARRRRNNQGGRFTVDVTEEDREIRSQVKAFLRRSGKKYGIDGTDY